MPRKVQKKRDAHALEIIEKSTPPIFLDASRRRLILIRILFIGLSATAVIWLVAFALSMYVVVKMPGPGLVAGTPLTRNAMPLVSGAGVDSETERDVSATAVGSGEISGGACGPAPQVMGPGSDHRPTVYAYLPSEPDWALASLGRDCGTIDVVMPEWYGLDLSGGEITEVSPDTGNAAAILSKLRTGKNPAHILPVMTIFPENVAPGALAQPATPAEIADRVAAIVADNRFAGLCLSPDNLPEDQVARFREIFVAIADKLSVAGRQTCLVAAAEGPLWRDTRLVSAADIVVFLAFRSIGDGTPAAPIAAQAWFEATLDQAVAAIGADRLVVALGNFAYDWTDGNPSAERIPYAEVMRRAARHDGQIALSPNALNTTIGWTDASGLDHRIWMLDAISARNARVAAERRGLHSLAVWMLGYEDPGIWAALRQKLPGAKTQTETIMLEDYVGYEGRGRFMHILAPDRPGRRSTQQDPISGLATQMTYSVIPQPYSIALYGAGSNDMIALTFDDGPDAIYTPQILDALREADVPATFFLIGKNVLKQPDLARRMIAEGHMIGSHTFFHPDIETIPPWRQGIELNALQRLFVSVTGHGTVLFRTPYGRASGPLTAYEVRPLLAIQDEGYVIVGSNAVPRDWEGLTPGGIVASAEAELAAPGGNVIVMHDSGGDRTATVKALPLLIRDLRAKGYRFVSLATMLGADPDALMPKEAGARATFDGISFSVLAGGGAAMRWLFWIAVGLGTARSLIILVLALTRRHYPVSDSPYTPTVTVVIPAFNEENVILGSIKTVLASDYPDLHLIVVDDGSQDHTFDRVEATYGDDPRVVLVREANLGKWMALDTAYARIETEIVVAIDADTVIRPDAIAKLVRAFRDPTVGAVAGKVQIGNAGTLLTRLQALEYITAQNIDRRAAETFNGIIVVPGAIGAWRADAVRKAGCYTNQTVTEDADLTVSVLRAGYRVVFEEEAVSITEAPETVRDFLKQRLRWTFGMMQTAWKHRQAAREGRAVGLISIPDLWLFGVVLSILAPVADVIFLSAVFDTAVDAILGRPLFQSPSTLPIIAGYLVQPALEVLLILLAFTFERKAPTLILLLPFQRFLYRQLLYITVYRSVWRALTGRLAGWGKVIRQGTIRQVGM
jgi:cellulose synthase/poly-beta-1,6-N-acetylglucosamine synthase-like glycosyltransferase/peptidoglycan/xylan/chitin deacetylase (PgdA/CDA1 family)